MEKSNNDVVLEGVEILPGLWRNFSGAKGKYNAAGKRNFNIKLNEDQYNMLLQNGYNVGITKENPDDPDAERTMFLKVNIAFTAYGPKVHVYTTESSQVTDFGEEQISLLDTAYIIEADVVIRPYNWEVQGKTGVAAYLKELYVRIKVDPLRSKYDSGE
jgi:hypothetical protein